MEYPFAQRRRWPSVECRSFPAIAALPPFSRCNRRARSVIGRVRASRCTCVRTIPISRIRAFSCVATPRRNLHKNRANPASISGSRSRVVHTMWQYRRSITWRIWLPRCKGAASFHGAVEPICARADSLQGPSGRFVARRARVNSRLGAVSELTPPDAASAAGPSRGFSRDSSGARSRHSLTQPRSREPWLQPRPHPGAVELIRARADSLQGPSEEVRRSKSRE